MKTTSKKKFDPPALTRILPAHFFMPSHLDSHRTTDIKPEMLSGVQTGNGTPHDKYNTCGIAHVCTNRKDDILMQRRLVQSFTYILEWGRGTCLLTKHTRRWTYSARVFEIPLCHIPRLRSFLFQTGQSTGNQYSRYWTS